jgi:hypothetical protein
MVGGAVADRWEPKRTIILGGLASALSIGLIAVVVAEGFWQGVFAALVVSAIASLVIVIALFPESTLLAAFLPTMVDRESPKGRGENSGSRYFYPGKMYVSVRSRFA